MQEKRTDELDELLEKMKPEQLGDYYKDNKKYILSFINTRMLFSIAKFFAILLLSSSSMQLMMSSKDATLSFVKNEA